MEKDIDYIVSFRRPSIDPPFVAGSSSVAEANDVAHNSVSNFDTDAEEDIEQNIPTDDDVEDERSSPTLSLATFDYHLLIETLPSLETSLHHGSRIHLHSLASSLH
ncbi:hypothetical protein L1987_32895 [Smallanthus sonchifolius]|uniref:Uncharacterized protein n=1 Tax=Smallanthus sonchifolius TaxID=185202 RepID=A0ACB9HQV2_9ASTR|nr:hypothetical protein L1987_32895 [Smallanthus sonchifolius]